MGANVRKADVRFSDTPTASHKDPPPKSQKGGVYQRMRAALKVMGFGQFEFETERDDRT